MTDVKRFIVVLLTILSGVSSVCANLGDGGDRIDDSYGNLIERHLLDDGTVSVLYHKDRYLYFVIFGEGRSVLEKYSHIKGTDLSEKEIARFLKANAAGATWAPDADSPGTSHHPRKLRIKSSLRARRNLLQLPPLLRSTPQFAINSHECY